VGLLDRVNMIIITNKIIIQLSTNNKYTLKHSSNGELNQFRHQLSQEFSQLLEKPRLH